MISFESHLHFAFLPVLNAIELATRHTGRVQLIGILQSQQCHRCPIEILVRGELQHVAILRYILQKIYRKVCANKARAAAGISNCWHSCLSSRLTRAHIVLHQILHLPPVGGEAFGQQIRIDGIRHVGGYIARGIRVLSLVFVYFAKVEGKKK